MMRREPLLLLLALVSLTGAPQAAKEQLVAAVYFGDWHVDPQMSAVHGANWTEFQLPIHATPRYPGHLQPNVPLEVPQTFGLGAPENQPAVMSRKIAAAVEHGVGMFLFDWYWYASPTMGRVPDLQGAGGGPFLDGALNDGFLKAPNREQMKFALMCTPRASCCAAAGTASRRTASRRTASEQQREPALTEHSVLRS